MSGSGSARGWVLDIVVVGGSPHLAVVDRGTRRVVFGPLPALTRGEVLAALTRLLGTMGRPGRLMTDHSVLFSGIGEAVGLPQIFPNPTRPFSPARLERLLRRFRHDA